MLYYLSCRSPKRPSSPLPSHSQKHLSGSTKEKDKEKESSKEEKIEKKDKDKERKEEKKSKKEKKEHKDGSKHKDRDKDRDHKDYKSSKEGRSKDTPTATKVIKESSPVNTTTSSSQPVIKEKVSV